MSRIPVRSLNFVLVACVLIAVFWPHAESRVVPKSDWSSAIQSTSDVADLRWDVKFKIESAPSLPFAFVSSHGRDILHGFHITVDLYGNGFLVLRDVTNKIPTNQIVWLGHPITGIHTFSMHFQQRDRRIRWKSVDLFFDGVEVPFHSGDPNKTINLKYIQFVPDVISPNQLESKSMSGEILSENLSIRTWTDNSGRLRPLILMIIFALFLGIQARQRMQAE